MAALEEQIRYKCFVDNGIILQDYDNLILQQSFFVQGFDYESENPDFAQSVSKYLSFVFASISSGWVVSVNNIVLDDNNYMDTSRNYFPHPILKMIDMEREYFFTRKEAKFFTNIIGLTFTFAPQQQALKKLGRSFQSTNKQANKITNLDNYIEEFKTNVELYSKLISRAMKLTPMSNDETVSYLNYLITNSWINFKLPKKTYINLKWLLVEGMIGGLEAMVGDKHLRVVAIDNYFPDEIDTLTLERLAKLGFSLRWNTKYYFFAKYDAQKKMEELVKMHEFNSSKLQLSKDADPKTNRGALYLSDEAEEALAMTYTNDSNFGRYSCHIILMHEDEEVAVTRAKKVQETFMEMAYKARIETINLEDAYFSSLDGDIENDCRRSLISTQNLADLLPLTGFWSGLKHHPSQLYPAKSNPLFIADCDNYHRFSGNIFDHDLGHGLIIGNSGYGKSSIVNFLIASHFRYENAQIFALDNKCSMAPLCFGANGVFYDLGTDNSSFQPLADIHTPNGYDFAVDWLEVLCEINNVTMSTDISAAIRGSLTSIKTLPVEHRTLEILQHHTRALNLELANVVDLYCGNETLQARIFSANQDNIALSNFNVFEMGELIAKGDRALIPAQKYIFYKIMSKLDGRPTLILIEEADTLWTRPPFARMLDEWLKTLRKLNVAIWMVALQPESIIESPIKASLLNQCATRIYTGNSNLGSEHVHSTYKKLGLSETQINLLKEAMPKRHYYISNSHGSRMFNFDLNNFDIAKAFLSRTSKTDTTKAKELKKIHGSNFSQAWLEESGIDYVQVPAS